MDKSRKAVRKLLIAREGVGMSHLWLSVLHTSHLPFLWEGEIIHMVAVLFLSSFFEKYLFISSQLQEQERGQERRKFKE